jgi:hypothetical protein
MALLGKHFYFLPLSYAVLFLLVRSTSAGSPATSIVHGASAGLALERAALKSLEAISRLQQWSLNEQVTLKGLIEDVSVASTVKYDFRVGGLGTASEGVEFTIGEEPSIWQEFGNLQLSDIGVSGEAEHAEDSALTSRQQPGLTEVATLPETEISGPVELWFRNSPNIRLAFPVGQSCSMNRFAVSKLFGSVIRLAVGHP